jgi:hypothetical protein
MSFIFLAQCWVVNAIGCFGSNRSPAWPLRQEIPDARLCQKAPGASPVAAVELAGASSRGLAPCGLLRAACPRRRFGPYRTLLDTPNHLDLYDAVGFAGYKQHSKRRYMQGPQVFRNGLPLR